MKHSFVVSLLASVMLIIAGLIYFMVTLSIIKFGSALLNYYPDSNWAVLSASILSVGAIIATNKK